MSAPQPHNYRKQKLAALAGLPEHTLSLWDETDAVDQDEDDFPYPSFRSDNKGQDTSGLAEFDVVIDPSYFYDPAGSVAGIQWEPMAERRQEIWALDAEILNVTSAKYEHSSQSSARQALIALADARRMLSQTGWPHVGSAAPSVQFARSETLQFTKDNIGQALGEIKFVPHLRLAPMPMAFGGHGSFSLENVPIYALDLLQKQAIYDCQANVSLFDTPAFDPPPLGQTADSIIAELLQLEDGWDGLESLAPAPATIRTSIEVISRISDLIPTAEIEVDGSTGEVSFSWYTDDHSSVVSVTVLPSNSIVVVSAAVGKAGNRTRLAASELDRVRRVIADAGFRG